MFCILSEPLAVAKSMLPFSRTLKHYRARKVRPLLKHLNKFTWPKDLTLFKIFIFENFLKENVP